MLTVLESLLLAPAPPREKVPILRPSCFLVGDSSCGPEPCLREEPPRGRPPREDCVLVSALALFVSFAVADAACGLDPPRDEMLELTPLNSPAGCHLLESCFAYCNRIKCGAVNSKLTLQAPDSLLLNIFASFFSMHDLHERKPAAEHLFERWQHVRTFRCANSNLHDGLYLRCCTRPGFRGATCRRKAHDGKLPYVLCVVGADMLSTETQAQTVRWRPSTRKACVVVMDKSQSTIGHPSGHSSSLMFELPWHVTTCLLIGEAIINRANFEQFSSNSASSSLIVYKTLQREYQYAEYLSSVTDKCLSDRRLLSKFRCGCHGLHVDTGRWVDTTREDRLCQICYSSKVVEDEQHFLFSCPAYSDVRQLPVFFSRPLLSFPTAFAVSDFFTSEPSACGAFL